MLHNKSLKTLKTNPEAFLANDKIKTMGALNSLRVMSLTSVTADRSFYCQRGDTVKRLLGSMSPFNAQPKGFLTFVRAVPEGARAADGSRPLLQRVGAAAQRVTLPVQVEGVLSGDAVGAAHPAAAATCWQVVLADVGRAHCTRQWTDSIEHRELNDE